VAGLLTLKMLEKKKLDSFLKSNVWARRRSRQFAKLGAMRVHALLQMAQSG
jgi:hypothetical protein